MTLPPKAADNSWEGYPHETSNLDRDLDPIPGVGWRLLDRPLGAYAVAAPYFEFGGVTVPRAELPPVKWIPQGWD